MGCDTMSLRYWSLVLFLMGTLALSHLAVVRAQDVSGQRGSNESSGLLLRDYRPKAKLVVPVHDVLRAKYPVVDVHTHFNIRFKHDKDLLQSYVATMDRNGIALSISLDATLGKNVDEHIEYLLTKYPNRFLIFANIDFQGNAKQGDWSQYACNQPGFARHVVELMKEAHGKGLCGLKLFKQLGLEYRNPDGSFVAIDDSRFDPIWEACAQLGWPVIMHTADPSAFFDPIDANNERLEELERHPEWAFPSPPFPSRDSLHAARNRVLEKHPKTRFIAAHLGNDGENLAQTQAWLDRYPNLYVEIASRISELGRQPRVAKKFIEANADRILFGTDGPWPEQRLRLYWRFLETDDDALPYSEKDPPPQGLWSIYGIQLDDATLRKIYHENAIRLIPRIGDAIQQFQK